CRNKLTRSLGAPLIDRVCALLDQHTAFAGEITRICEADFRISAEAHIACAAMNCESEYPATRAARRNAKIEIAAVCEVTGTLKILDLQRREPLARFRHWGTFPPNPLPMYLPMSGARMLACFGGRVRTIVERKPHAVGLSLGAGSYGQTLVD